MDFVGSEAGEPVHNAAGPVDLNIGTLRFCQPDVDTQITLRDRTASAAHFIHLTVLSVLQYTRPPMA